MRTQDSSSLFSSNFSSLIAVELSTFSSILVLISPTFSFRDSRRLLIFECSPTSGFAYSLLNEDSNPSIELARNDLANYFSCSPSQINYVIKTRFTESRGYIVESKIAGQVGNHIFLPAVGMIRDTEYDSPGSCGGYWSSSLPPGDWSDNAKDLFFTKNLKDRQFPNRCHGLSIRPVSE